MCAWRERVLVSYPIKSDELLIYSESKEEVRKIFRLQRGQDPLDVWNLNIIADQIAFTLAATARLKSSPTFVRVWGSNERAILLCVLRRSRSSYAWRLCRVSEGLFLDYG